MSNPNIPTDGPMPEGGTGYTPDAAIFGSPDAFVQAKYDTTISPEVRGQLEELEHVWSGLAAAEKSNGVWNEHIRSDVTRAGEALEDLRSRGYRLSGHLEDLQHSLTRLGGAVYGGDLESMGFYSRDMTGRFEDAQQQVRALKNSGDGHSSSARVIKEDAEVVGDLERQMRQPGAISEQSLEAALVRARDMMAQGASLGQVLDVAREELYSQLPVWGQRREVLEALGDGMRRVMQEIDELDVNTAAYAWEELAGQARYGRMNADDVDYIRRAPLAHTQEAVADINSRIARVVSAVQDLR